ncbi:MAG: cyclic nucleotide-binding domain-containing protein [Treponema sp.]|nr:cyclic nucleotide-binding domain-containing protein [Treponema sp.]
MLHLQVNRFQAGAYLIVEGKEDSDHFYIIQQGRVSCQKGANQNKIYLGPGDFLGVVSCFATRPQIETIIAETDVQVIAVKKSQYADLIVNNTPVALKIIKTFANRTRQMNDQLTKLTLHKVENDNYEHIFNVAQYYEKARRFNIAVFAYYQYLKTKPTSQNLLTAQNKFRALKPKTHAVYFEPTPEMTRTYPEDAMIFSESAPGAEMFIIQSGHVAITKVVNGNEVVLAVLGKGDMFGEMALLENKPRSASAIAKTECTLMVVNRHNFNTMVSTQPQLISRLTTTLGERLWSMYRQLDNAKLQEPIDKMIDILCLQLEKQRVDFNTLGSKQRQTDFTVSDLATMCGLDERRTSIGINSFMNDNRFKVIEGKIFIKDITEVYKASFYARKHILN